MVYSIFDKFIIKQEANKLASLVGLKSGWKVAEVGAGSGELSKILALLVGEQGAVYASEFEESKILKLEKLAKNLHNLKIVHSKPSSANLPEQDLNLIVMRKVYHHFTNPVAMNESFYNALLPGGKLVIIDFAPKWYLWLSTPKGIPLNRGGHGIKKELVIEEVCNYGFKLEKVINKWSGQGVYLLFFKK